MAIFFICLTGPTKIAPVELNHKVFSRGKGGKQPRGHGDMGHGTWELSYWIVLFFNALVLNFVLALLFWLFYLFRIASFERVTIFSICRRQDALWSGENVHSCAIEARVVLGSRLRHVWLSRVFGHGVL